MYVYVNKIANRMLRPIISSVEILQLLLQVYGGSQVISSVRVGQASCFDRPVREPLSASFTEDQVVIGLKSSFRLSFCGLSLQCWAREAHVAYRYV